MAIASSTRDRFKAPLLKAEPVGARRRNHAKALAERRRWRRLDRGWQTDTTLPQLVAVPHIGGKGAAKTDNIRYAIR